MRNMFSKLLAAVVAVAALAFPMEAFATEYAANGTVASIYTMTTSSGYYPSYHYYVSVGGVSLYAGGSFCTGIGEPSAVQIQMLQQAQLAGATVSVIYTVVSAKNCITAFSF